MAGAGQQDAAESFDPLRPKLMRVAYRMLGAVADAEDVLQEAFIRWMGADRDAGREQLHGPRGVARGERLADVAQGWTR